MVMKNNYNMSISFAKMSNEEIKNMREELVLQMSGDSLKRVSDFQLKRVGLLNPKVHILLTQYKCHAVSYPRYNDTAKVGGV